MIVFQGKSPKSTSVISFVFIFKHLPYLILSFSNYSNNSRKKSKRSGRSILYKFYSWDWHIKYNKHVLRNFSTSTFLGLSGVNAALWPFHICSHVCRTWLNPALSTTDIGQGVCTWPKLHQSESLLGISNWNAEPRFHLVSDEC